MFSVHCATISVRVSAQVAAVILQCKQQLLAQHGGNFGSDVGGNGEEGTRRQVNVIATVAM